ncbi:MAG: hypothetical protein JWN41_1676, partial [Thermoleophilia bacterium]|nr:hypothetical protein [Thermoleophilia bacterium]
DAREGIGATRIAFVQIAHDEHRLRSVELVGSSGGRLHAVERIRHAQVSREPCALPWGPR